MLAITTLIAASAFALVHIFVGKVRFLEENAGLWKSSPISVKSATCRERSGLGTRTPNPSH